MALRLITSAGRSLIRMPFGSAGIHDSVRCIIGNRDIVGFGVNGDPEYVDCREFPFPSIRWRESTPDVIALREKEKGDWRKLNVQEKKSLYRANFCQTFSEFSHASGEWKSIVGSGIFISTLGIWLFIILKIFVYECEGLPKSFDDAHREAQLQRMLDSQMNIVYGISSLWDYERECWKR